MRVELSGTLRAAANDLASIEIEARTILELVNKLKEHYPRLAEIVDGGIAVSINGEIYRDVRDVVIPEGAEVFLLPRIEGG